MSTPVIHAQGLRKSFGDTEVVCGIDFAVQAGQCFGVLGPNGAGKTTTLRMILGMCHISDGLLEVFGQSMPAHGAEVLRRVGVMPQDDNLDPDFTVEENLRIHGGYFGIDKATLRGRAMDLLRFVGLEKRAHSKVDDLSGGMQRRLTFARALINDPELIVLDEPTTGLDPQARHMIWSRLRALLNQGKTLLLTTHYMEEAERLCDELIVIEEGRILERDSPTALMLKHVEPEVIEIRGVDARISQLMSRHDCRLEHVGDTFYCYTQDARPIVAELHDIAGMRYLQRPSNLEDVFLKLTGRDLRD